MIELGKKRQVAVFTIKKVGTKHVRVPVIEDGTQLMRSVANEPVRITRGELRGAFGRDKRRKLVVALRDGDIISLHPYGTRQWHTATLFDVYSWMLRCKADAKAMARLRTLKATKQAKALARSLR